MNARLYFASVAIVTMLTGTQGFAAENKVQQTRSIGGDFRVATTENWQPSNAPARFRIALPSMSHSAQPVATQTVAIQTAALPDAVRKDLDLR